jgi:hypothetical protein
MARRASLPVRVPSLTKARHSASSMARGMARRYRHGGPPPDLLTSLPEQYFTRIVTAAAAARALPGPRLIDLGRGNPDLPPPPVALEALQAGLAARAACTATRPSRAARSCARRSRRTTAPTTAWSSTRARGRPSCRAPRRRSCSPWRPARRPARPSPCPTPATPTTSRPSRWPGFAGSRCRSTPPAGSRTSMRWARNAPRSWSSTTPPTRARPARRRERSRRPWRGRTSAAAGCSTTSPTPSWPSTGAGRAASSRSTGRATWPSSCGRRRRSTAWQAGAWAWRSATRRSSAASACCSTICTPASPSRCSSGWWRR